MDPILVPDIVEFKSKDIDQKHTRGFVFLGDHPATPLRFSVEARAEGIPEWDGPDYQFAAYLSIYYEDGSQLNDRYLCFAPGTHPWQKLEYYFRPRLKTKRIVLNYFFEHKIGNVAYRNARIEPCAPLPKPDKRIVLLGDSNVLTSYLPASDRVDAMLGRHLAESRPGVNIDVENVGGNGDSIKRLMDSKRYERDILTLDRADVVFIRYSGNDRKIYGPEEFERRERELIGRLRTDFPSVKIIMETGAFIDYPAHYSTDSNPIMAPYHDATRRVAADAADGLVDVYAILETATRNGNWDFRFRKHPHWKLVLDGRFDREHEFAPEYYSNGHFTANANRLIAQAEHDLLIEKGMI